VPPCRWAAVIANGEARHYEAGWEVLRRRNTRKRSFNDAPTILHMIDTVPLPCGVAKTYDSTGVFVGKIIDISMSLRITAVSLKQNNNANTVYTSTLNALNVSHSLHT